jgi:AraC-like DNA-binding protein
VGLTPAAYRQRLRLERARWLLVNTDLEVGSVGLECGFDDAANFARAMRQGLRAQPARAARGRAPGATPGLVDDHAVRRRPAQAEAPGLQRAQARLRRAASPSRRWPLAACTSTSVEAPR